MTSKTTKSDPTTVVERVEYKYNLQNRLSRVETFDGSATLITATDYRYNPQGIRVAKVVDDAIYTDYLIDPYNHTGYAQVLEETDFDISGPTPVPLSRIQYTIGDDVISQTKSTLNGSAWTANQTQYLLYDGHGSTRQLAGPTQTIAQSYDYDAYGVMLGSTANPADTADTNYLYAGEQYDSSVQQYYNRARYYNPSNGLFNRVDPYSGNLHDPQSLHKYLYCHNNPVNGIDPSGEMGIIGVIGAISISLTIAAVVIPPILKAYRGVRTLLLSAKIAHRLRISDLDMVTQLEIQRQLGLMAIHSVGSILAAAAELAIDVAKEAFLAVVFAALVAGGLALLYKAAKAIKVVKTLSFGRKLDFLFNRNINPINPHNVARARANAQVLNQIGIDDLPQNRKIVEAFFNRAFNDSSSIVSSKGTRITREFFLPGKTIGGAKIIFVHEGDKLITMIAQSGSLF